MNSDSCGTQLVMRSICFCVETYCGRFPETEVVSRNRAVFTMNLKSFRSCLSWKGPWLLTGLVDVQAAESGRPCRCKSDATLVRQIMPLRIQRQCYRYPRYSLPTQAMFPQGSCFVIPFAIFSHEFQGRLTMTPVLPFNGVLRSVGLGS